MTNVNATRRGRLAAALAGLALGALATLFAPPAPASAHAALLRTSPAQGSVVSAPPAQIVLTFSEPVEAVPDKVKVIGPDGKPVDQGEPVVTGSDLSIAVRADTRGTYLVSYRVISADSHPVAGGFTYSVGAPSEPPTADVSPDVDPVIKAAIPTFKYLGYGGLVLVVGPVLVLAMLWPQRLSRRGPARLIWAGLGLVALSAVGGLLLQAPYATGAKVTDLSGAALSDVLASQFGTAHLVRLGVLAASVFLLRPLINGTQGKADYALLAILGVLGLGTWPLAGHPAASPLPAVSVVVDAVHLAAMAVWLGGLVMLGGFLLRQANERELGAILPVWSRWATAAVINLFLAGVVNALIEVNSVKALIDTGYGQLILAKTGLFALVMAVAWYSRRLVIRREGARLRPAVWVELGITAIVLALSANLVQTTPARTAETNASTPAQSDYVTGTLNSDLYQLQFDVDPARVGNNTIHLFAYDSVGNPKKVVEWKATAALSTAGVEPITVPMLRITDNHAIGDIQLPAAGQWEMRFTLRTSDIDQATVSTTVTIR
ncbi:copper resistance CopC/CopD family protein [Rhizomonospora bruguierae]|uniref:copper resistance CopC/CopD family protein n=1 Tax=Rhizomonospora bruguierae TaxID=1581705 RepID=UPI001BCBF3AB|nr:copper resistance protein CopC [Micromonospora sp. NBRC 107566]